MKKKIVFATLGVLALGAIAVQALGGMAWLDSLGFRGEEHRLRHSIEAYWQARVEGDLSGMAAFMHPLQTDLVQPGLLITEAYELLDLTLEEDQATASILVRSRVKHPRFSSIVREGSIESRWVKYEGEWYLEPQPIGVTNAIRQRRGEWVPPTGD